MALAWNEIRSRALAFSKRWEHETSEDAEAKAFWTEFLNVFGIDRKRVASFEEPVKKLGDKQGYIDLFWKGVMLSSTSRAEKTWTKPTFKHPITSPALKSATCRNTCWCPTSPVFGSTIWKHSPHSNPLPAAFHGAITDTLH